MNRFSIKEPLFGSWYIDKELGSGAFGTVYKIKREDIGGTYYSALKVIKIPADKNEVSVLRTEGLDENSITTYYKELVQDLVNEIKILASLKGNSNIVSYEDHLIVPNESSVGYTVFIRMELLKPLNDVLASHSFIENDVIKLGIDVCKALELCERSNIIHRDIKPDNLFISDMGDYKLGDFGVARTMEKTVSQMSQKGTNSYMAPEVFLGREYDKTVDIYSLGIVMYMLLNNNRGPFLPDAPNPIRFSDRETATKRRMNGDNIPPLKTSNRELNNAVLKACAFKASDRFQSAEEFLNALKALSSSNIKSEYTPPKTKSTPVMDDSDEKTSSPFNTVKTENNKNNANLDDLGDIFEKTSKSESPSSDDDYCEKTSSPFGSAKSKYGTVKTIKQDGTVKEEAINPDDLAGDFSKFFGGSAQNNSSSAVEDDDYCEQTASPFGTYQPKKETASENKSEQKLFKLSVEITKEQAQKGCTRRFLIKQVLHEVPIPAGTVIGSTIKVQAYDTVNKKNVEYLVEVHERNNVPPKKNNESEQNILKTFVVITKEQAKKGCTQHITINGTLHDVPIPAGTAIDSTIKVVAYDTGRKKNVECLVTVCERINSSPKKEKARKRSLMEYLKDNWEWSMLPLVLMIVLNLIMGMFVPVLLPSVCFFVGLLIFLLRHNDKHK